MRHRVSLRQIQGFLLAADLLSFARASEEMHITQSAFSQLIRELESQLGVQLFDRTTRRILLTAAGEAMRLKMRRGLDEIDDACDEAQAIARIDRGHIRLGTLSSLAIGVVTRTLAELRRAFPGITVSMREDFNDALVELVASGATDISVCAQIGAAQGLSLDELYTDELVLVMRSDHKFARRRPARPLLWGQLADEPLVLTARGTATRTHGDAALATHGIVKPLDYEVASTPTALAMVRAGFGSAFVSRVALLDTDITGMRSARFAEPPLRRMGIYRRSDRTPSPASMKFAELLRGETERTLARLN